MDTLRLVGGAVVAYLGIVLVIGFLTVLPNALSDLVSLVSANATHPVALVDIAVVLAAALIVALAVRKR